MSLTKNDLKHLQQLELACAEIVSQFSLDNPDLRHEIKSIIDKFNPIVENLTAQYPYEQKRINNAKSQLSELRVSMGLLPKAPSYRP